MNLATAAVWSASILFGQINAGTTEDRLQELQYFVGTWQVTGSVGNEKFDGEMTWKWINNKNFLTQSLAIPSRRAEYLEVVGWDPEKKSIASWGFGTYGGHGKFLWRKGDSGWQADVVGRWIAWDGTRLVQNRSWQRIDEDHFVFEERVSSGDSEDRSSTVMRLDAKRSHPKPP